MYYEDIGLCVENVSPSFYVQLLAQLSNIWQGCALEYRNTIAGSPPGERIFISFEKIRFAS
jgi:hypothetical protein